MSATTSTTSDDVAARERRRATEHSLGTVSGHVKDQWSVRALIDDVDVEEAWQEAKPIHYPSAKRGAVARYHRRTDTVLLARQGGLVTCIKLMDRPWSERIYVRNQVTEQ
ncbi:hypothetical protein [Natronorubrum halophilum]|uniref:hypothetical protein n=1 Tax=Natronorubrum halophilum TaxID=1702106 RepID=UPI0010C16CA7|nr:hypothetical protein [Natronorubrum halophilum]